MIQLELAPELEQRLTDAAENRGLKPGEYAAQLVSSAVALPPPKRLSRAEVKALLSGLAELGKDAPALPDYAYTRGSFYEDHD